jgi:hypothetical protein
MKIQEEKFATKEIAYSEDITKMKKRLMKLWLMDGSQQEQSETDGAHLARTKAPSKADGAPSEKGAIQKKIECGLLTRARGHMDGPRKEPSETDGEQRIHL